MPLANDSCFIPPIPAPPMSPHVCGRVFTLHRHANFIPIFTTYQFEPNFVSGSCNGPLLHLDSPAMRRCMFDLISGESKGEIVGKKDMSSRKALTGFAALLVVGVVSGSVAAAVRPTGPRAPLAASTAAATTT